MVYLVTPTWNSFIMLYACLYLPKSRTFRSISILHLMRMEVYLPEGVPVNFSEMMGWEGKLHWVLKSMEFQLESCCYEIFTREIARVS